MKRLVAVPALLLAVGTSEAHADTFRYSLSNSTTARAAADAKAAAAAVRARLAGTGATVTHSANKLRVSGISRRVARERVEPQGQLIIFDWEGSLVRSVFPDDRGCRVETVVPAPAGVGRTTRAKARARARACLVGGEVLRGPTGGWYGIVRTEKVSSKYVVNPRVATDPATGKPTIAFRLNKRGAQNFKYLTTAIARRGRLLGPNGHHYAMSIDQQLFDTPLIDGDASRGGLSAAQGLQLSGGLTRSRARELVTLVKHPLPGKLRRLK